MKYEAKVSSYMEDCCRGIDLDSRWITKGKIYDIKPASSDEHKFIDDEGDTHYVSKSGLKRYFVKMEDEDGKDI